jgi:hypothetical protein
MSWEEEVIAEKSRVLRSQFCEDRAQIRGKKWLLRDHQPPETCGIEELSVVPEFALEEVSVFVNVVDESEVGVSVLTGFGNGRRIFPAAESQKVLFAIVLEERKNRAFSSA